MIITICGDLGSGKSTVAKILAHRLKFLRLSVGDFMGELALKKDISLMELSSIAKKDGGDIDSILDEKQKKLSSSKENIIFDSRLGWFFVPNSFKIYLKVDLDESSRRIYYDHRSDEKENTSLSRTKENIVLRKKHENERYFKHYGIKKYDDPKHFDLIINTTNISAEEVAEKIIEKLRI